MKTRQKFHRYIASFFALTLLVTISFSILPHTARAAGDSGSDIKDNILTQVKNHQKYYWLRSCFYDLDIDEVTESEMEDWDFFKGADADRDLSPSGYQLTDSTDNDAERQIIGNIYGSGEKGTWACTTPANVEFAFNALGVTDPKEAFCKLDGARFDGSGSYDYDRCHTGAGADDDNHTWDNTADSDTVGADFDKEVDTWAPTVKSISDEQNYVRYYLSFMNQCDVTLLGAYHEGDAGTIDDKYEVPVVNSDSKEVQNKLGQGIKSSGSKVAIVESRSKYASYGGDSYGAYGEVINCNDAVKAARKYAAAYAAWYKNHTNDPSAEDTDGGPGNTDPTCESEGGPLAWVGCSALLVLDGISNALDSIISNLLFIDKGQFDNDGVKNAWGVMRNIALLILVPMMMLMVIGTALEFGPFDAYTVKKALPRMMLAVIFIVLSLVITQTAIRISNSVGDGVGNLLNTAMNQAGTPIGSLRDLFNSNDGYAFYGLAAGGLTIGALTGFTFISWGILGSLALVTIVALLIGALILVIRQVLIIFLVILAPLAILVWIFPGNDKLWKVWRATFTAMLLMYPLIVLLILSGRFFAGVVKTSDPSLSLVNIILMLAAYITPYFLIPTAFKYGLGVFGNLAGMINDRSRGLFDRQRKLRAEKRAGLRQAASEGNRFAGSGAIRSRYNRGIATARNAPGAILTEGATFKPSQWSAALRSNETLLALAEKERAEKENISYNATKGNDGLYELAKSSTSANDLRQRILAHDAAAADGGLYKGDTRAMEEDIAHVERVRRSTSDKTFRALAAQAAFSGGTAHDRPVEALEWAAEAAGDDAVMRAHLTTVLKNAAAASGRYDTNAAWGTLNAGITEIWKDKKANNGKVSARVLEEVNDKVLDSAEESNAISAFLNGKAKGAENLGKHKAKKIQKAIAGIQSGDINPTTNQPYTQEDLTTQLADVAVLEGSLSYGPQGNAEVIRKNLLNATLVDAANPSLSISVHDLANDETTTSQTAYQQRVRTGTDRTIAEIQNMREEAQRRGTTVENVAKERAIERERRDEAEGRSSRTGIDALRAAQAEAAYRDELNNQQK